MNDCIERAEAIRICERLRDKTDNNDMAFALNWAIQSIKGIPAEDVRPVVLCRDCVHYEMGVCLKIYDDGAANKDAWQERKPDDYCSYGEDRNVPANCGADMREINDGAT